MDTKQAAVPGVKTWATMDKTGKAIFAAKVCLMLCSFGYIFGGVLVEGMVYESYPSSGN